MLQNFEEYTEDLSETQRDVAYRVAQYIQKQNSTPVTGETIIYWFRDEARPAAKLTAPLVRKMVNYICRVYLPNLIGTSKGYFITNDKEQLKRAAQTLRSRANENTRRAEVLTHYINSL